MFFKNIKVFQGEYLNLSGKGIHAKIRFLPSFKLYFLLPYKKEKGSSSNLVVSLLL